MQELTGGERELVAVVSMLLIGMLLVIPLCGYLAIFPESVFGFRRWCKRLLKRMRGGSDDAKDEKEGNERNDDCEQDVDEEDVAAKTEPRGKVDHQGSYGGSKDGDDGDSDGEDGLHVELEIGEVRRVEVESGIRHGEVDEEGGEQVALGLAVVIEKIGVIHDEKWVLKFDVTKINKQ